MCRAVLWRPVTCCYWYTHRPSIWLTISLSLCSPLLPLWISTIANHVSAIVTRPSRNTSFFKVTILSHRNGYGSFSYVTYLIHPYRGSAIFPGGTPDRPMCSPCTETTIFSHLLSVRLRCLLVALVSELPRSLGNTACRYPPSGLSCALAPNLDVWTLFYLFWILGT